MQAEDFSALRESLALIVIREELAGYLVMSSAPRGSTKAFWSEPGRARPNRSIMASRANAAVSGRDFVTPDDVKAMALPVLEHRLILAA